MSNVPTPEWGPWWELLAVLGLGSTVAVALAALLGHCVRNAIWERAIWQACTVAIVALVALELTGLGQAATQICVLLGSGIRNRSDGAGAEVLQFPLLIESESLETLPTGEPSSRTFISAWWLAAAWGGMATALLGRMLWQRIALILFQWRCWPLCDAALLNRVRDIAARVGARRSVRVMTSAALRSPAVFYGLHPTLALPRNFTEEFTAQQQDAVLAHELSHLARRDPAWLAAASLACALLWWQPLVWWSRRRLRMSSEAAADEASMLLPGGPSDLASSLVRLARRLTSREPVAGLAMHGNGLKSELSRRVERLLSLEVRPHRAPRALQLALVHGTLPICFSLLGTICTAWAPSRHSLSAEETTMNVVNHSWRTSLAATVLWAVLGTAPAMQADDATEVVAAENAAKVEKKAKRAAAKDRVAVQEKLREFQERIARLKEAGKTEEAEKLAEKAERFARKAKLADVAERQAEAKRERDLADLAEATARQALEDARLADKKVATGDRDAKIKGEIRAVYEQIAQLQKARRPEEAKQLSDHALAAARKHLEQLLKEGRTDEAQNVAQYLEEMERHIKQEAKEGAVEVKEKSDADSVEQKLRAMKEQIERLMKEGRKDEASKLAQQLEVAVRRLHADGPKQEDDYRAAVERKLREMKEQVERLHKEGHKEEAARLEQHLIETDNKLRGSTPIKGPDTVEHKLQAVRKEIEELHRRGRTEEAQMLEQKLKEFLASHSAKVPQDDYAAMETERRRQRELQIKQLHEVGRHAEAEALLQELKGHRGKGEPQDDLRAQLEQMRRELQEVREQLRQLQAERERG